MLGDMFASLGLFEVQEQGTEAHTSTTKLF